MPARLPSEENAVGVGISLCTRKVLVLRAAVVRSGLSSEWRGSTECSVFRAYYLVRFDTWRLRKLVGPVAANTSIIRVLRTTMYVRRTT
jgi:hypothetical protein